MLHKLLDISSATCSNDRGGTSFGRRFGLRVLDLAAIVGPEMLTRCDRLLEVFNGLLLTIEASALLVVQPAELLKDLCVIRIAIEHAHVRAFGGVVIFLLLVDVTDLKPDVFLAERARRVCNDVLEALQARLKLLLLLVYYAESEIDLVGLFKVGFHSHDLGESFFCVFKATVAIIEDTYAVPELGFLEAVSMCRSEFDNPNAYLGSRKMVKSLLIGRIRLLEIIHHEIAVTCGRSV